jgi:flagella basal body P-ring formation protein FlgA
MHKPLIALTLLACPAWAEGTMVATLLPPPVEALREAPALAADTIAVPVLKEAMAKGETITPENLTTKAIPTSQVYASTITSTDALIGQQLVRPLTAGQPLNKLHVRVAPAISRNQMVTLLFRRGGVELSGRAQALEDGQLGQSIRIINPATRSTLLGTVAAGGVVEVN